MNVTKNELITALNYIGIFPKSSLKKEELNQKFNDFYEHDIDILGLVINSKIYELLEKLVESDEEYTKVSNEFENEIDFLEKALIIDSPVKSNKKIQIKFNPGMEAKFSKFINCKNRATIRANDLIVNLIVNITEVYGLVEDYEITKMIKKYLSIDFPIKSLMILLDFQLDLRNNVYIVDYGDNSFIVSNLVEHPLDIIKERELRDLTYKDFSFEELEDNSFERWLDRPEAIEIEKYITSKGIKKTVELILNMIIYFMCTPKIDIQYLLDLVEIPFDNIDDGNKYLQLVMNLHNNVPHYCLYGYSPSELTKILIQKQKEDEKKAKETKVGRNDPCPCGSGKKYKKCCMNKVIQVDFNHEQYEDCIEESESRLFFVLKNLLLNYTNKKYNINKNIKDLIDISSGTPEDLIPIRNKLWSDDYILKSYIRENPDNLLDDEIEILKEWDKKKLNKEFMLYKYEKEYALFLSDDYIYYVKGLRDTIRNLVPENKLPQFVKTVLLPYRGHIVYDSYIESFNMVLGPGIKKNWDEKYKKMLKENKVKYTL